LVRYAYDTVKRSMHEERRKIQEVPRTDTVCETFQEVGVKLSVPLGIHVTTVALHDTLSCTGASGFELSRTLTESTVPDPNVSNKSGWMRQTRHLRHMA
jgi:hypothetical protein